MSPSVLGDIPPGKAVHLPSEEQLSTSPHLN